MWPTQNSFWAEMIDRIELTIFVQVLGVTLRYTAWIDDQVIHSLNACHTTLSAQKNLTEQGTTNGGKQTDLCYWQAQ